MITASTVNYAGRQVDLELLQTVTLPGSLQRVYVSNIRSQPKIVTGVQKALQRYVVVLLQELGTVRFADDLGTSMLSSLMAGGIGTKGALIQLFALSNSAALQRLAADNANVTLFGTLPADERITAVALDNINLDYATGTVSLTLVFSFAEGSSLVYVLPVTTART